MSQMYIIPSASKLTEVGVLSMSVTICHQQTAQPPCEPVNTALRMAPQASLQPPPERPLTASCDAPSPSATWWTLPWRLLHTNSCPSASSTGLHNGVSASHNLSTEPIVLVCELENAAKKHCAQSRGSRATLGIIVDI